VTDRAHLISLVVPLYNQLHYTRQCLESIRRHTSQPYELILVDNASSDGTPEYLQDQQATVITNKTNLGCAKAWNQGVRASSGHVIGILNNDIVVTPGWLEGLLRYMEGTSHGIVSPAAREGPLNYDLEAYARKFTGSCRDAVRAELYGACFLVRREVFDQIGLFDEGFAYGGCEDIDFFWRAQESGFSIGTTGSVLIHHFGMVTQDAIKRSETKAYPAENLAHFKKKWNRTIRGNWFQRRWTDFHSAWRRRYEQFRYGHTMVEKNYG
jgi:N-acetylglucosaminyl-diphospho-decaprenol L-rhamnosyltransferase